MHTRAYTDTHTDTGRGGEERDGEGRERVGRGGEGREEGYILHSGIAHTPPVAFHCRLEVSVDP